MRDWVAMPVTLQCLHQKLHAGLQLCYTKGWRTNDTDKEMEGRKEEVKEGIIKV